MVMGRVSSLAGSNKSPQKLGMTSGKLRMEMQMRPGYLGTCPTPYGLCLSLHILADQNLDLESNAELSFFFFKLTTDPKQSGFLLKLPRS